ncbi:MAG: hypothetical protein K2X27_12230, partial [Candidatus Obscuribacterales bacterium]|nr:hypothetical protein [Candidatus Obscuribacterales bacterium]
QTYKNTWHNQPIMAASETLAAGGAAYLAYRAIFAAPRTFGMGAAAIEGIRLMSDVGTLLNSTDTRDRLKYGIAGVADLSGTIGGLALMSSRYRIGGAIGLAVGIGGRLAADFIPNRLVLSDITRKADNLRPPLNPNIERLLGL